ncbi:hypothetical protein V5O48_008060 [Marasmius crinis-equi]|uniref:MYND-type domain-containing protein n=1 Tax=Marasmius crinis-equi TaxID=585013 RepID=A0ABR3FEX6_9AGAR
MSHYHYPETGIVTVAHRRFPTAKDAIAYLGKLGPPPDILDPTTSNPKTIGAVQAIASLPRGLLNPIARYHTYPSGWVQTRLTPWIRTFVEKGVLAHADELWLEWDDGGRELFEDDDSNMFSLILKLIPFLFCQITGSNPANPQHIEDIKSEYLKLKPALAQVWFLLSRRNHAAWGRWASLLADIAQEEKSFEVDDYDPPKVVQRKKLEVVKCKELYGITDDRTGLIFVDQLNRHIQRLPEMDYDEIRDIRALMYTLDYKPSRRIVYPPAKVFPIYKPAVLPHTMRSFLTLVNTIIRIIRKRKIHDLVLDDLLEMLMLPLRSIKECVSHVDGAAISLQVLESQFFREIFLVHDTLQGVRNTTSPRQVNANYLGAAQLLEEVSRHVVHPDVLRGYIRQIRRIPPSLERQFMQDAEKRDEFGDYDLFDYVRGFWKAWEMLKDKALTLIECRRQWSERGRCCRLECRGSPANGGHYLLCLGCKGAIYCSRECRKVAWKEEGHAARCRKAAPARVGGVVLLKEYDIPFFHAWLQYYTACYAEGVERALASFLSQPSQTSESSASRLPFHPSTTILMLSCDLVFVSKPEDAIHVIDRKRLEELVSERGGWNSQSVRNLGLEKYSEEELNSADKMPIIGLFPRTTYDDSWLVGGLFPKAKQTSSTSGLEGKAA